MYLSKLEIIGFKSFAQKTLLKFDAGMTAIVGPNGCGKTNVVDAIRWALGEQRASTLRSDLMENVIFNGTRTRKPLGMSEVSLTIENTKGILPTEYREVTITRRLFRSGESEYLLNKAQCRLKDIIELFMDTGMGANAYSVIELKMIETILSDRTEERRKLFEEAAGVTKYKARRKEALRRLEQVALDLSRVDDIVKEVTKSVATLERQAERAKRHAELSGELRSLEIELIEREFAQHIGRMSPLREELSSAANQRDQITGELSKYEALLDVLEREEHDLEAQLASGDRAVHEKSAIIQRTRETIVATEERLRSLAEQRERATTERERLILEKQELTERLSVIGTSHEEATRNRAAIEDEMREKEQIKSQADDVLRAKRQELSKARDEVYTLLNLRNQRSNELERRRARSHEIERRLAHIEAEQSGISGKRETLETQSTELARELETANAAVAAAEQEGLVAQDRKEQLKTELDTKQNESFALQGEIGKKISKIEFFTSLVEQGTGAGEAAEYLMAEPGWASQEPIMVADAFTTDAAYRAAFESVLGEIAYYLIVPTSRDAFEAVEVLRHSQKGKATLVALDRVPAPTEALSQGAVSTGARRALSLAKFDEKYGNLFQLLLGSIVIVDTVDQAYATLDADRSVERCVTIEGEVITRQGFVRGGSRKSTEGIVIGKREQIEELEIEVENLKAQLEICEQRVAELNSAFEAINIRAAAARTREREEARRAVQVRSSQVEYELRRSLEQLNALGEEAGRLRNDLTPLTESLAAIAGEVAEFERQHSEAMEGAARSQLAVETAEQLLADESRRWTEVQVHYAGLSSEITRLESERLGAERAIASATQLAEQRVRERERAETDHVEHTAKLETFRTMLTGLEAELASATGQRDELAEAKRTKQAEAHTYREALREERARHNKTIDITHELELKLQEIEQKVQALRERAAQEFEILSLELKSFVEDETGTEGEAFSFGDARESVRELKQKIKNLGAVNLLAYDEFQKESERLQFLTAQRKDLNDAQRNLAETIEEINQTATRQFVETFEEVRKHFQDIFRSLFAEGDECDLNLEADKDPLEAQIEITAKPRGKRAQSIDLLSQGEKTMTAIALLFAIYLVKPSPFCILDEVDAPLDDSNIDRFLTIIRRFAQNTQFIVVTHNKRTMAAADALYGVTQEEDGLSKIVSVRLKREGMIVRGKGAEAQAVLAEELLEAA
ncbi:MAG: chromosome segregation protein SMC [Bacteroidota bacterium]|nr:chromosome segregation protein SMC [Bacteroidota bacterium]MDP4233019.1 chromosome segregation protein SMC [Bacteroidota bacterium]MDP4241836.1 chromosome segregation protein SMC [Bacteroidota bacterium]MDP4288385.1 chromosome segregation protein SMC [Bacteroidota bacterium]